MRIAYLCSDFAVPIHGHEGASIRVRELSRAIKRLGHEIVVFSPRRGGPAPAGFEVEVSEIELELPEKRIYELLSDDRGAGEAAAREVRSLLYATALRYRLAAILDHFRPDAIYERYSLLGSGGLAIARGLGIPLLLEVNATLNGELDAHRELAFGQTARALERSVFRDAERVIAPSRRLAATIEDLGVAPSRIAVLANGVDVDRFAGGTGERDATRAKLRVRPTEAVVGFVGSLGSWHGAATLVRAMALLRERGLAGRLLLVGDGPHRPDLEALARAEGIGKTTIFLGSVSHERVPAILAAMDVATVPYDSTDGVTYSPLKLYEAMAAGRPVVAAAAGQMVEAIRDGETGVLYPPGDIEALAEAIAGLVGDRSRAAAIALAGQEEVRAGRSWEANARAVVDLVTQVRRPRDLGSVGPKPNRRIELAAG